MNALPKNLQIPPASALVAAGMSALTAAMASTVTRPGGKRKSARKNNSKIIAGALVASSLALPTAKANASPILDNLYDTGSGAFIADFRTTNPVNQFSYSIPINYDDRNLILDTASPLGYNCNPTNNFGEVLMYCRAIPGDQTNSGFLGFNLDLEALGWSAGTSMQDLVDRYGTSPQNISFELDNASTERGVLNLPSTLYPPTPSSVPIPATVYLFLSGLLGMAGISRKNKLKAS